MTDVLEDLQADQGDSVLLSIRAAQEIRALRGRVAELEAKPPLPPVAHGTSSMAAYTREHLARLAFVTFYSPVLCAPENIAAVDKEIDCCPGCDHAGGSTCRVSERGDYCPNDLAETLRQISVALYGPGEPSHYVAAVFGPDKMPALDRAGEPATRPDAKGRSVRQQTSS